MANPTIADVVIADLTSQNAGANVIGATSLADGSTPTVRDRWNSIAQVNVTDVTPPCIYVQTLHNGAWIRAGAKIGTAEVSGTGTDPVVGRDLIIPV